MSASVIIKFQLARPTHCLSAVSWLHSVCYYFFLVSILIFINDFIIHFCFPIKSLCVCIKIHVELWSHHI
uniref:Uncharacterized protein n=1 Tax=Octopus bimaculoides TaxID=37653 RepID=A0A0L8HYD1_OCTBM